MSALFPDALIPLKHPTEAGAERRWIPHGDAGTADTITGMQQMVDEGKRSPRVRELAGKLIANCPKKDWYAYAKAIFDFCHDQIQYAYDPHGVEWVESPDRILDAGIADCDSICVLFAALCEAIGLVCRYVTVRANGSGKEFSHVYAQVYIPGRGWVGADCTMRHAFGWEPTGYESKNWPASSTPPSDENLEGLDCDCERPTAPMHGLRGMADFSAEDFDPFGTTDHQLEVSTICDECAPVKASEPESSGFFLRDKPRQNYLTGLGAAPSQGAADMLADLLSGRLGQELTATRTAEQERVGPLVLAAQNETDPARKQLAQAAFEANRQALAKTQEAINQYNAVATKIQTFTFGQVKPDQLSGLGFLPAAVTPALILSISALLLTLTALVYAMRNSEAKAKGLFEQIAAPIDATAHLVRNVAIAAVVGVGLYFGVKYLRGRRAGAA